LKTQPPILPLIFVAFCLTSCGGGSSNFDQPFVSDPLADQYDGNAINIGSIANSPAIRNSVLLGVRDVNDAGGVLNKKLNVVAFVSADVPDSVALAKQLLKVDIKAIHSSFSSRSLAISELSIPKQIPLISESATSTFFSTYADNDFFFRMVPSDVIQSKILADLAFNQGFRRVVTVHNQTDPYGETLTERFKQSFEQLGGEVIDRIEVPFTVTNGFDSFLARVAEQNPDLVLEAIVEPDISANWVNESISFGIKARFLFPDAAAGVSAFVNNLADPRQIETDVGTAPGFGLATNPEMILFEQLYRQQFGLAPESFTVSGYDLVLVTALAIERAGFVNGTDNPSGLMIRDSLREVMNPPGKTVSPSNLAQALQWVKSGIEVNYSGAYGANDWDAQGDITGEITYDVMSVDSLSKTWKTVSQQQVFIPLLATP